MKIFRVPVGPFEMNCYLVKPDASPDCLLIDPGDDPDEIISTIETNGMVPRRIVNTHTHIDHLRRVSMIQKQYNIPFQICQDDLPLMESLKEQGLIFGLDVSPVPEVTGFLKDNDIISLADLEFRILHTPGHSPGSICLYIPGHVFVGDVLFRDSIGRTDLYGGNYNQLMDSLAQKLLVLPGETIVYPGHGPETTIGREKANNPFLRTGAFL